MNLDDWSDDRPPIVPTPDVSSYRAAASAASPRVDPRSRAGGAADGPACPECGTDRHVIPYEYVDNQPRGLICAVCRTRL